MLEENPKLTKYFTLSSKITVDNVNTIFTAAKNHNLFSIAELSIRYIERNFSMIVETKSFSQLDFSLVAKILGSSELNIHSEVEVFNAANDWLKQNSEEQSKCAKQLLLKVRLSLLSQYAIKYLLDEPSFFSENKECVKQLKETLAIKTRNLPNNKRGYYTSRYCYQNEFNVLLCGGYTKDPTTLKTRKHFRSAHQTDWFNLNNVKDLPFMKNEKEFLKAVCFKGEVYVFCDGYNDSVIEKYSPLTNTWSVVAKMHDRRNEYSSCAFMHKIFIFGGSDNHGGTSSCLRLDTNENGWKTISRMSIPRQCSACAVFEGNIVVSGGYTNDVDELNSVESYDVFADKWSPMPSLIDAKAEHSSVAVKDKLFVIGREKNNCEMFDRVCERFVSLNAPFAIGLHETITIGKNIKILRQSNPYAICYNVENDEWSTEPCKITENRVDFSCAKFPWY